MTIEKKPNLKFFLSKEENPILSIKYPNYYEEGYTAYFEVLYPFPIYVGENNQKIIFAGVEFVYNQDGQWIEEEGKEVSLESLLTGPNKLIRFCAELLYNEGFDSFFEFVELIDYFEKRWSKSWRLKRKLNNPIWYFHGYRFNYNGIP